MPGNNTNSKHCTITLSKFFNAFNDLSRLFFKITQNKSSKKLQYKYFKSVVTGVLIQYCYRCYLL